MSVLDPICLSMSEFATRYVCPLRTVGAFLTCVCVFSFHHARVPCSHRMSMHLLTMHAHVSAYLQALVASPSRSSALPAPLHEAFSDAEKCYLVLARAIAPSPAQVSEPLVEVLRAHKIPPQVSALHPKP